jgi:MoxR-like ATPase
MDSGAEWAGPPKEANTAKQSENQERVQETINPNRLSQDNVLRIKSIADRLHDNVERVIVGKSETVSLALVAILCEGHILLEDVPGTGKTMLAKTLSRSIGCSFNRIQFTPDLMPSDVTGIHYFDQKSQEFVFREGPLVSQIVLADEINRATPRTQSALLEAMEEGQITVEGKTNKLPRPFMVIATQNPVELEGTFPLPEAQLDRFLLRLNMGYPSAIEEDFILERFEHDDPLINLNSVAEAEEIMEMAAALKNLHVDISIRQYVVELTRATREESAFELGASPRASLALFKAVRAYAAINGRDYALPDDVKKMAPHVLAHRLILSSQARLRGRSIEDFLSEIIERVPVPITN